MSYEQPDGGEPVNKCGAKTRNYPYSPCQQPKGFGTNHPDIGACRFHGGLLPNHNVHAERVRIEEAARTLLNREDLTPIENPLLELQLLAAEVVRFKEILGDKVEELGAWTTESIMESEEIRAIIAAYERALDRTMAVLSGIVRLNVEDRLAKVSAAQTAILVRIVEAVFATPELGLSREQIKVGKSVLARETQRTVALPATELAVG
jgi:hypothetical protein